MPLTQALLLSPPSLSSYPEKLKYIINSKHDDEKVDLQMFDRLALGVVSLPSSNYDMILLLADAEGSHRESSALADKVVMEKIMQSLKPGGRLSSQPTSDGFGDSLYQTEAILAGLISDGNGGFIKPEFGEQHVVRLRPGKKKQGKYQTGNGETGSGQPIDPSANNYNGLNPRKAKLPGKIDFTDDFSATLGTSDVVNHSGDDLIDEDDLLGKDDLDRPIVQRKWHLRGYVYLFLFIVFIVVIIIIIVVVVFFFFFLANGI